jgi:ABC-type cobalamin/Fe3+-siderophores transport system ATPase subunit
MKITKVNIPTSLEGITDDGLKPIEMSHLGSIVILAGKNGAGKSRILSKILSVIQQKPIKQEIENVGPKIVQFDENIKSYHQTIANLKTQSTQLTGDSKKQKENQIDQFQRQIDQWDKEKKQLQSKKSWSYIETDTLQDHYQIVEFVPKKLDLKDCNALTPTQLKNNAEQVKNIGISQLSESCLAKIKKVVDNHFNATHQYYKGDVGAKQNAIHEHEQLDILIQTFIGERLGRNVEGDTTLFGLPIGSAKLSDGHKVLLQLCVAIHAQGASLDNMILFLDEPENHMHPSVTIEFLDTLIEKIPNGQIWMATHSIPLISHFGAEYVWYVDNGKVRYAGKEQEKVLESLLGDENEISRLSDFINLPVVLAINNFAYECLASPEVAMTSSEDPQSKQIGFILIEELKKGKVKLLDYGAGKGRFISNFYDRLDEQEKQLVLSNFEYVAFDKYKHDESDCLNNIERVYGNADKKYYNDLTNLLSDHDKGSFDIVVLCNVLHEIDPKEWIELFKSDGTITPLLKADSGILLHVEDMLLPIGEKAYKNGFVVLDTPNIKELFSLQSADFNIHRSGDAKYHDRLKAHSIPQKHLANITADSRKKALQSVKKMAKDNIVSIRSAAPNHRNGKKHAFWTQQFANSSLALDEL